MANESGLLFEQAKAVSQSSGVTLFRALNILMVPILKTMIVNPDSAIQSAFDAATAHWLDGMHNTDELVQMKLNIWQEIDTLEHQTKMSKRSRRRNSLLRAVLSVCNPEPSEDPSGVVWDGPFEPGEEESVCSDYAMWLFEFLNSAGGSRYWFTGVIKLPV